MPEKLNACTVNMQLKDFKLYKLAFTNKFVHGDSKFDVCFCFISSIRCG